MIVWVLALTVLSSAGDVSISTVHVSSITSRTEAECNVLGERLANAARATSPYVSVRFVCTAIRIRT